MPSRVPSQVDFPSPLNFVTASNNSPSTPTNILLLLHGLGDTATSFSNFAKALNLPKTSCIVVQAPSPLPFDLGGFHWGDDIVFDQGTGETESDTGFRHSTRVLVEQVVEGVLIEKCGYKGREILMLGYGQGGMAALAAARSLKEEIGGVVSIGGPLPNSASALGNGKVKTPISVLGGSSKTLITSRMVEKLKETFEQVEYHQWKKACDTMPRNRGEMLPIMQFFARRLRSRKGMPEGGVEVG